MVPELIELTGVDGTLIFPDWLARSEAVHRQLRPGLPADYCGRMQAIFSDGGRMVVARSGESVLGVAVWRLIENTYEGRRLYVHDLVTDEACRSQGIGKLLLDWLEARAIAQDCDVMALTSGVQRVDAHKFYYREEMYISSFCFRKALK